MYWSQQRLKNYWNEFLSVHLWKINHFFEVSMQMCHFISTYFSTEKEFFYCFLKRTWVLNSRKLFFWIVHLFLLKRNFKKTILARADAALMKIKNASKLYQREGCKWKTIANHHSIPFIHPSNPFPRSNVSVLSVSVVFCQIQSNPCSLVFSVVSSWSLHIISQLK